MSYELVERPAMRSGFAPRLAPEPTPKPPVALFYVELAKCRFTLQSISPIHLLIPPPDAETGPIVVSILSDGNYFVHNGRHRVVRALMAGDQLILARSLYEGDGTEPA